MLRGATLLAAFIRAPGLSGRTVSAYPPEPKHRIAVIII